MTPNPAPGAILAALLAAGLVVAAPAHADSEDDALHGVPPASSTPYIAPVHEITAPVNEVVAPVWGIIERWEDLSGDTRRDSSSQAERFTLKGDVFFDIDKAELTSTAEEKLAEIIEELREVDISEIEVGGHTDTVDSDEHNDKLSEDRAETVAEFLREELDDVDITAEGYGKRQLAAPEEGTDEEIDEARSRNRRVEITVTYRGEGDND